MSKNTNIRTTSKKNTKNFILTTALSLFNQRGIEYVGVREIAAACNLRVGNVTYYFPTKDDIVLAIAQELSDANNQAVEEKGPLTMSGFLTIYEKLFTNQYQFRCLPISAPHLMEQNKKLAVFYKGNSERRFAAIHRNLKLLKENGYLLNSCGEKEFTFLVAALSIMGRFWLSEAKITFPQEPKKQLLSHYLHLIADLLRPYATAKGKKEILNFSASLMERLDI